MARTLKKIKRKNKKNSRKRKYQTGGSIENLPPEQSNETPKKIKTPPVPNAPVKKKQQSLT